MKTITRDEAFTLLKKYNKDPFHIQHALTVEAVMKWYANELGYGEDAEYWGIVGLLHDIDFELYPEEHCLKAPEMLREAGVGEDVIHSVVSHGYGITVGCGTTIDVAPEHEMEKRSQSRHRRPVSSSHPWYRLHAIRQPHPGIQIGRASCRERV